MDESEKRYRASEAERLLNEPLLKEAFVDLERDAIEQMVAIGSTIVSDGDDRARRVLADRINAIRDVQLSLRRFVAEGKRAADQPERWA